MNKTLRSFLAIGMCIAALATSASAQVVLGERSSAVGVTYSDIEGLDDGIGAEFFVNAPIHKNFDVGLQYAYTNVDDIIDVDSHDLRSYLAAYKAFSCGKPFVLAHVGWNWLDAGIARTDSFTYGFQAGMEFSHGAFSFTPFADWTKYEDYNSKGWSFGARALYKLNDEWAVYGSVIGDEHGDAVTYSLGTSYRF